MARFYLSIMIILLQVLTVRSQTTPDITNGNSLNITTVNALNNFYSHVQDGDNIKLQDSLLSKISKLTNWARTLDDSLQKIQLLKYIKFAEQNLKKSTGEQKNNVIRALNKDLELKMDADSAINALPLENKREIFKQYQMTFRVRIKGMKPSHSFTVYWARFIGRHQRILIQANAFEGSFLSESDKFDTQLVLPGYYTFWLQNTENNTVFQSDPDHLIIINSSAVPLINFIPLQNVEQQ